MFQSKNAKISILFLCLATLVSIFFGLNQNLIGDASLYGSISKRMFLTGNYQNLYLLDHEYIQKPHVVFWLASISYGVFGINSFAFKFFSAVLALSGVYGLYKIGEQIQSKSLGKWIAMIWLFSLAFQLHLNDIHMDTMMSGFVIYVAYFWIKYLKTEHSKFFLFGCIPLALAMMTKGPLGAFIPITGLIFAILLAKKWTFLFRPVHFLGIFLLLILVSPVVYFIYNQHGVDGVYFYFIGNNTSRIEQSSANVDYSFYLHTLLWFFVPWALLLFYRLFSFLKDAFTRPRKVELVYVFGSFICFFLIASVSAQQAPHYIFTLLPFLSIITGYEFNQLVINSTKQQQKIASILLKIPSVLLLVVFICIIFLFPPSWFYISLFIIVFVPSFYFWWKSNANSLEKSGLLACISIALVFSFVNIQVFENVLKPLDAPVTALRYFEKKTELKENLYIPVQDHHNSARIDFYANCPIQLIDLEQKKPLPQPKISMIIHQGFYEQLQQEYDVQLVKKFEYLQLTYFAQSIINRFRNKKQDNHFYLVEMKHKN